MRLEELLDEALLIRPRVGIDDVEFIEADSQSLMPAATTCTQPGELAPGQQFTPGACGYETAAGELGRQVEVGCELPGTSDQPDLRLEAPGMKASQGGQAGDDPKATAPLAEPFTECQIGSLHLAQRGVGQTEVADDERWDVEIELETLGPPGRGAEEAANVWRWPRDSDLERDSNE